MKKFLWIIALIAVVFIGDRVGGMLLQKLVDISQFRYSRLYRGEAKADLLLVGNSRGLMFYQPYLEEVTGQKTFNISYNALSIDLAKNLIADQIKINGAPKIMILDITMCDRKNDRLISGFQAYRSHSENLQKLIKERQPKTFYGGVFSHLFRFNSEIFHRALYYENKTDETWLIDRVINEKMIANLEDTDINDFTIKDYLLDNLIETVKLAQNAGVDVKLVVNPYYPLYRTQRMINIEKTIQRVEAATNLKVHDYSTAISDLKSFGDFQHLNKYGSRLFIDEMVKDGIIGKK
jgi:hypothetical protein